MSTSPPRRRLVPARPDVDRREAAGYKPRLPWRWILLGTMSVVTVAVGYWLKEERKADELRSQLQRVHEAELEEPARRYRAFRDKLERLILEAGKGEPETFVDERLRLSGLRAGQGLYLRLPADQTEDREAIEEGAKAMAADVIPACLGLAPASARGLWEKGDFLMPDWIEESQASDNMMGLRVTDEMLARHIRADLPAILNLLQSQWFLLVIERGENRREDPVDVYLWDLRRDQKLLSARVEASGALLPVRVRSKGAPRAPGVSRERLTGSGAADCSIAAEIKRLAGRPIAQVEHTPPLPDAGVAADGGG